MSREVVKSLLHTASYEQIAILYDKGLLSTPFLIHTANTRARSHVISGFRPNRQNARSIAALNNLSKVVRKTPDLCVNPNELAVYLEHFKYPRPESILSSVITRCRNMGWQLADIHDQEVLDAADSRTLVESSPMVNPASLAAGRDNAPAEGTQQSSVAGAERRDDDRRGEDDIVGAKDTEDEAGEA